MPPEAKFNLAIRLTIASQGAGVVVPVLRIEPHSPETKHCEEARFTASVVGAPLTLEPMETP